MTVAGVMLIPELFERNWSLSEVTLGPILEGYGGGTVGIFHAVGADQVGCHPPRCPDVGGRQGVRRVMVGMRSKSASNDAIGLPDRSARAARFASTKSIPRVA